MSEESVLKSNNINIRLSRTWPALFLIVAGGFLLIAQTLQIHIFRYLWPSFLVGFGLLLLLPVRRSTGQRASRLAILSVPGAILVVTGALLLIAGITDHYRSLAYTWPLILAAGAAGYSFSKRREGPLLGEKSYRFIRKMIIITMVMAITFELVIFRILGPWWPLLLVGGGLYLWTKSRKG